MKATPIHLHSIINQIKHVYLNLGKLTPQA